MVLKEGEGENKDEENKGMKGRRKTGRGEETGERRKRRGLKE